MKGLPNFGGMFRNQTIAILLIASVVFLVMFALRWGGLLHALEMQAYDAFLRARAVDPPREPRVVILAAGEAEIERFGWPLPDEVLADLLARLLPLKPEVVGLACHGSPPSVFSSRPPGHS